MNITQKENKLENTGEEESGGFDQKSSPPYLHLLRRISPPSFLPPSTKKAKKRYNLDVINVSVPAAAFHLENVQNKKENGENALQVCAMMHLLLRVVPGKKQTTPAAQSSLMMARGRRARMAGGSQDGRKAASARRQPPSPPPAPVWLGLVLGGFFWGSSNNSASVSPRESSGVGPLRSWY